MKTFCVFLILGMVLMASVQCKSLVEEDENTEISDPKCSEAGGGCANGSYCCPGSTCHDFVLVKICIG